VNYFTVTAEDRFGRSAAESLEITQVSLEAVVVSEIKTHRLSVQEVEELVNQGVIDLDDPENFNVSKFDIVLTVGKEKIPISVPIAIPINEPEQDGFENVPLPPPGKDTAGKPPPSPRQIVIFEEALPSLPGQPSPPPIPGVIIIEGRIKSLKEFFSVRLLLMNISGIFTLSNTTARISFPLGGLSHTLPSDGVVSFGDILPGDMEAPGQAEREFIIRGDEIGLHPVEVQFGGTVIGPGLDENTAIPFNGSAMTDVEVKGPPPFLVEVSHPDHVEAGVPYEVTVDITNMGDIPAMYASLELEVGDAARLIECSLDEQTGEAYCQSIDGPAIRNLGHLLPGEKTTQTFSVESDLDGPITSCMAASDQNIQLQVLVGDIGCAVGHFPPERTAPDGRPSVSILPVANAFGIHVDSPVAAFFSERMDTASITSGPGGSFNVYDDEGALVAGRIHFTEIGGRTAAIWQAEAPPSNRLQPNMQYIVQLTTGILDMEGQPLAASWSSQFSTTGSEGEDITPPVLSLTVVPPTNPNSVIPGELVHINAYASDQGSGVRRVELRTKDLDAEGAAFTLVDQKSVFSGDTPPFFFVIDSGSLEWGHTYQLQATAYDGNGNAQNSTLQLVLLADASPPLIVLPDDPAQPVLQGISLQLTPLSATPGIRSLDFFLDDQPDPFRTATLAPYQTFMSSLDLDLGDHAVRVVATDALGQTGEDQLFFTLVENLNGPQVSFSSFNSGASFIQGERFSVRAQILDPVGVETVKWYLNNPEGPPLAEGNQPLLFDTTNMELGAYRLYLVATNALGISSDPLAPTAFVEFSVVAPPPGEPPPPPSQLEVYAPEDGNAAFHGVAAPGARIDVNNASIGLRLQLSADAAGKFQGAIDAEVGNELFFTATDLSQSPDPSEAVKMVVPEPEVLLEILVEPDHLLFDSVNSYRDLKVIAVFEEGMDRVVSDQCSFRSLDPAVAGVSGSGRVVALKRGETSIEIFFAGQIIQVPVVCDIISLVGLSVDPSPVDFLWIGQTVQLGVLGLYDDGSSQTLTSGIAYLSENTQVVTVNSAGVVTATGDGTTHLTVYAHGVTPVMVQAHVRSDLDPEPSTTLVSPPVGEEVERGDVVQVSVRAQDDQGGVTQIALKAEGAMAFEETIQVSPASNDKTVSFALTIPADAPIGQVVTLTAWSVDTSGKHSDDAVGSLVIVDRTPPQVLILEPEPLTTVNFGDTVTLKIEASDTSGIVEVGFETAGAISETGATNYSPSEVIVQSEFQITIPFNLNDPEIILTAFALDAEGLRGDSIPVRILVTDADITPPETVITAVSDPENGAIVSVTYDVLAEYENLDHVELYFRRNGLGTFSRFTDPRAGNPEGHFHPDKPQGSTILFDCTQMGGDGDYEWYTVGVDFAGNREPAPENAEGFPVGDENAIAQFSTGAEVVEITSDIELSPGDFEGMNLRIRGARVVLSGTHTFLNLELLEGAALIHPEATLTEEFGLELHLDTLSLDETSSIDLDGRGYLGGNREGNDCTGRTLGNLEGSTYRSGGSHGGTGGVVEGAPNPLYGSMLTPEELGSGGSCGGFSRAGGDGGGRMALHAINLVVDGLVSCNGQAGSGFQAGGGAGGSIFLNVATVSGTGSIRADGGAGEVGGGGGRIAINYYDYSTMTASIHALGGSGSSASGGNGTVFLKFNQDSGNGTLLIDGKNTVTAFSSLPDTGGHVFDHIILTNGARVLADAPIIVHDRLEILKGSILSHSLESEAGLSVEAKSLIIDETSSIDVTGKGYRGGGRDGNNNLYGLTLNRQPGADYRSGGSYGGYGGVYDGPASNPPYGHPGQPHYLGSGGSSGGYSRLGGNGGGAVRIETSQLLQVDGLISANGQGGESFAAGSGSGGSIWITTSAIRGKGVIQANGGSSEVGGGGGRVAIEFEWFGEGQDGFNSQRDISAFGGKGSARVGSAGTILLRQKDQAYGTLVMDEGLTGSTSGLYSPLTTIGRGVITAISADTISLDGSIPAIPGGLIGLGLRPNTDRNDIFTVVSNTATNLTVDITGGTTLLDVAEVGDTYSGLHRFDHLHARRGAMLVLADQLKVAGELRLEEGSKLTHYDAGMVYEYGLWLEAGSLFLDTTSSIDVNGRGYLGGAQAGNGAFGRTLGNVEGASYRSAGSFGGLGGAIDGIANPVYGSLSQPNDLGSGGSGGGFDRQGGDGGGRVWIEAGTVLLNGIIRCDGIEGGGFAGGSGSGGSVFIHAAQISGSGIVRARGGGGEVGGGGGRIGVQFGELQMDRNQFQALGGPGSSVRGGNGTVVFRQEEQSWGDLVIDGMNQSTPAASTPYPSGYLWDNVIIQNRAQVVSDDGIFALSSLDVLEDSVLTHSLESEEGLTIDVGTLYVDPSSRLDVTGKGYRGGRRDGNPNQFGLTLGGLPGAQYRSAGSYGGFGGFYDGLGSNFTYGHPGDPKHLGSGGSGGGFESLGGNGGGRITIRASETVQIDGTISASGSAGANFQAGSGSGGSILIETSLVKGLGTVQANGGAGELGGGGGRIAVHFGELQVDRNQFQALGGTGSSVRGGNGTVVFRQEGQSWGDLVIDGMNQNTPAASTPYPSGYLWDNVIIQNRAQVVSDDGIFALSSLDVLEDSVLTHSLESEQGLMIEVETLYVDPSSRLDVTGKGYRGGRRDGNPNEFGLTLGGLPGAQYRSAGSYGGFGGLYEGLGSNPPYGHPGDPKHLGSGGSGGGFESLGGNGGGRITIRASEAVQIDGIISASGSAGSNYQAGSGSGGSILIETSLLKGVGTVQANGGAGELGGGGGRIAVFYDLLGVEGNNLDDGRNIVAWGGKGSSRHGSAGTVFLRKTGQAIGDLIIDDGWEDRTASLATPLTRLGYGLITDLTENTLSTDQQVPMVANGLVGLEIQPDLENPATFIITANTEHEITVDISGGTPLNAIADVGSKFCLVYRFDNLFIRRGGFLVMGDRLAIRDTLNMREFGRMTHHDSTLLYESGLEIWAGTLDIGATTAIDLNGRGYLGGGQNGNDCVGQTLGNVDGSSYRSGGSYGGLGAAVDGIPNTVYGSETAPFDLGSGGSCGGFRRSGNNGGGRLFVEADRMVLSGVILSNGLEGGGYQAGSGSGGSVFLRILEISGEGEIHADGGAHEVGGGGGRIAIYFDPALSDLNQMSITANGGGGSQPGEPGTVYFENWNGLPETPWPLIQEASSSKEPRIDSMEALPDGSLKIVWSNVSPNAAAVVEFKASFNQSFWEPISIPIPGPSGEFKIDTKSLQGWFRVRVHSSLPGAGF
jgi:hypothetical protein